MKSKLQIALGVMAASILTSAALAQNPNPNADQKDYPRQSTARMREHQWQGAVKANDIIGMTVKNHQGEKLGDVKDLAIDVESGRIVQVILSIGGFVGIGDTLTAVPPGVLRHDMVNKVLQLDADKEKLKNAPKFEMSRWSDYSDSNHLYAVYNHYGEQPAFGFIHENNPPNTVSTRKPDGTWENRNSSESQSMIPSSRLAGLQKASKLIGTSVKNLQDEKVGKVEDLLVDLPSGRILFAIVSSGGFLGIGDELSAIPPTALQYMADGDTLKLDASKEQLSRAPHFKNSQWPDFNERRYSGEIYRAYRVEPYFATDATTAVDNTARNVRDRNDQTLTPPDQSNNKPDLALTTQIRKEIMAREDLSVNAKNIKITTMGGRVTLRGPVNTTEEKRSIGEIADRIASGGNVDNQLEVKLTPTGR